MSHEEDHIWTLVKVPITVARAADPYPPDPPRGDEDKDKDKDKDKKKVEIAQPNAEAFTFYFKRVQGDDELSLLALGGKGGVYPCIASSGYSSLSPSLQLYLRQNIKYRASDIVIATYPKCGTTLTEQIVLLLLNGGNAAALDPLSKNACNLQGRGLGKVWPEACIRPEHECKAHNGLGPEEFLPKTLDWFDSLPTPRVIKTHAKLACLLGNVDEHATLTAGTKYIVCTRNPFDAVVSCFYHSWNPCRSGWPFAAWAEAWVRSEEHSGSGDWFSWHKHWHAEYTKQAAAAAAAAAAAVAAEGASCNQILWCHYERLLHDPHGMIREIAEFIGIRDAPDSLIQAVVSGSEFSNMKSAAVKAAAEGSRQNTDEHLRRGKIGDWRSHFGCETGKEGEETVAEGGGDSDGLRGDAESRRLQRLIRNKFQQTFPDRGRDREGAETEKTSGSCSSGGSSTRALVYDIGEGQFI